MKEQNSTNSSQKEKTMIERYGVVIVVSRLADQRAEAKRVKADKYEFLMIHRSKEVIAPGALCFPGGGIESGETPEQAAIREFREEIGLEIKLGQKIWNNITPWNVALSWFSAELINPDAIPNIETREVADWKWMSLSEIMADSRLLLSNLPFLEGIQNGNISLTV